MAEIFFVTRGHKDHVDKFVRNMRSQYFPMKFKKKVKDENGKEMDVEVVETIDGQLRPYQLWGFVCPEEFVQPICNNLGIPTEEKWFDQKPEKGGTSFMSGFGAKGFLEAMRLGLGAKKLPPLDMSKGIWHNPIYRKHMNVLGVGWRSDKEIKTTLGKHEGI